MKPKFEVKLYDRRLKKPKWTGSHFLTEKQMLKFVKRNSKPNRIVIEGFPSTATKEQKKRLMVRVI